MLGIRQPRTVIPIRRETSELRLSTVPAYFKERFQAAEQGEQDPGGDLTASVSSEDRAELGRQSWKSREAKAASLQGKIGTGESFTGKDLRKVLFQGFR